MTADRRYSQTKLSGAADASRRTLTGAEYLAEITDILAAGLMRAVARKSSPFSADDGEISLHIAPDQSGDPLHLGAEKRE